MKTVFSEYQVWVYSIRKILPSQPLLIDRSKSVNANLNMGNKKIINLATPTHNTDAVNKTYADTNFLKLSGGNMTGDLTVPNPTTTGKSQLVLNLFTIKYFLVE